MNYLEIIQYLNRENRNETKVLRRKMEVNLMYKVGQWIYGITINEDDIEESELCGYLYMGKCGDYIICTREYGSCLDDFKSQLKEMYQMSCSDYFGVKVRLLKKELVFNDYDEAWKRLQELGQ